MVKEGTMPPLKGTWDPLLPKTKAPPRPGFLCRCEESALTPTGHGWRGRVNGEEAGKRETARKLGRKWDWEK